MATKHNLDTAIYENNVEKKYLLKNVNLTNIW